MPRKRKDLGAESGQRIREMMARGCTVADVAAALGISRSNAGRRCKELRDGVRVDRAARRAVRMARPAPPLPEEPEERGVGDAPLPEGAGLAEIDKLYQEAVEQARLSHGEGNAKEHQGWVRLAAQLLESRRKLAPPPKEDPNAHPDMVALARRGRERLHALIETSPE